MFPKKKLEFKTSIFSIFFYFFTLVVGFVFVYGFIYNISIRKPFSWSGTLFSFGGAVFLIIQSVKQLQRSFRYKFELVGNNIINEYLGTKLIRTITFKSIEGIKKTYEYNQIIAFINFYFGAQPLVSIYGKNLENYPIHFEPSAPISIPGILLNFKKQIPALYIDPAFAQDTDVWYHRELFGKINKERLFLLIFLIIFGIPFLVMVVLIGYFSLK